MTSMNQDPFNRPEYSPVRPTKAQSLALRGADILLRKTGSVKTGDERDMLSTIAKNLGGFEPEQASADVSSQGLDLYGFQYVHPDAKPKSVSVADDGTSTDRNPTAQKFKTEQDFADASGTTLARAASAAISGRRNEGVRARTSRGRIARKMARFATKGVGVQAHIDKAVDRRKHF